MRAAARVAGLLVGLPALANGVAWACTCGEPPTAEEVIGSGDLVVVGTVTDTRVRNGCSAPLLRAEVDVVEHLAGPTRPEPLEVQTQWSSAACGLSLEPGQDWVLQVADGPDPWVSSCDGSWLLALDGSQAWLEALRDAARSP